MKKTNQSALVFCFLLCQLLATGQSKSEQKNYSAQYQIIWQKPFVVKKSETETCKYLYFEGASVSPEYDDLPVFSQRINLTGAGSFDAELINANYENLSDEEVSLIKKTSLLKNQISVSTEVVFVKKQPFGMFSFIPIRRNVTTGKYEKLVAFDLSITQSPELKSLEKSIHSFASHSVLQNGKWYKIAVANDGIYKVSFSLLQSLGIDVASINPQNIRIFGNGIGMLPEMNTGVRPDDLIENTIYINGESDSHFDVSDYILFYGKGGNTWTYNPATKLKYQHSNNLYSDSSYYFITTDAMVGTPKRIQTVSSSSSSTTNVVNAFDDYAVHEVENTNFIKSGKQWFGEYFDNIASYNFSFNFPNINTSDTVFVKTNLASRKVSGDSGEYVASSGVASANIVIPVVAASVSYAITGSGTYSFFPTSPIVTVNVTKNSSDAIAWLDYIEVSARRNLTMNGSQMIFRDRKSIGAGNIAEYHITAVSTVPLQVWDITDPANISRDSLTYSGSYFQFAQPSDVLKQYVAFTGTTYLTPVAHGEVPNQDLHGMANKEFIIVAYPDYLSEAQQLAHHHEMTDTIYSNVVTTQQVFNEFSSGRPDVCAIRDFMKMFYDRAISPSEMPKYLLLYGDGSYDNKNRLSGNTAFIPTYESFESFSYTTSYVSDDFYGCLDDAEGATNAIIGAIDIGIGRFPVKSKAEAASALDKVLTYTKTGLPSTLNDNNTACSSSTVGSPFGDWRNTVCFIADDEDGDAHHDQANAMATRVDTTYNDYNIDKIYFDAYRQVATPGGDRYPDVNTAIDKRVEKGCLIMNYTGHGGEVGLAHERVVEVSQINGWKNINNMPLIFTATCELSRWDDPARTSGGEYMFLNPNGAGIALFTTTRESYSAPNFTLNDNFYQFIFKTFNGRMPRLGDAWQYIKDIPVGFETNGRNFTMLGDPALTLAYPKLDVSTDTVNNIPVTATSTDTLRALTRVTVSGYVRNKNGTVSNSYNGVLYPTVYDKPQNVTTLSNDGAISPPRTFKLQKNVLYKGKVSVINGFFKFTFIVPKDINYQYGTGRISYYAENGSVDANGYCEKIIIGGSSTNAPSDLVGPELKLYLNDNKFVYGGTTNETPDLYSLLKDENGINTVGNGIGHDITAILDANTNSSIVLNDYYQADLNSYKSGSIRYPFSTLPDGKHTLKLKAWDVYDNSSDVYTEFVVAQSAEFALTHVLNYPNPFTTKTQFYFEENQCCQNLEVQIQIYTVTGKIIKTLNENMSVEGFRSSPIDWDGRDEFGDKIGRGVYIYKVKVRSADGISAEQFEKLVLLR